MTAYQPSYDPAYASAAGYDYAPAGNAGAADYAGALPLDYHVAGQADSARQLVALPFVLGLVWGLGTGFSYLITVMDPAYTMFAALTFSAVLMSFINPGWIATGFNNKLGLLMTAHVAVVLVSGV